MKSLMFLLTMFLSLTRPSLCSANPHDGSTHGTVNIVLANSNGIVVLTDSMLTQKGHQIPEPGQKLFVLNNRSVCTIAGLYQGPAAFEPLDVSTRSKIYAFARGLKTAKPLTLQEELSGLVFIFSFDIDIVANVNDFERAAAGDPTKQLPIQLTVAGFDLDGVAKVLKATIDVRPRRFKGYGTVPMYEPVKIVNESLVYQTAGMSEEVDQILDSPESKQDDPILQKYASAVSQKKTGTLSLTELNQLASRLAQYAAKAHPEVGGDDQVAILRKGLPPEIHQHKFEDPPPSPPIDVYSHVTFTTTSAKLTDAAERLKAYRPTLTGRRHIASLYIESSVITSWIPMDGNLFIGDTFEGCTFYYDGGETELGQTNDVYDSDLLLGPHADLGGPVVQHLLKDFKWVNVGQTDMGLDPPPNYQAAQKVAAAPKPPRSKTPVVVRANFPLFTDQAGTQKVPNITGVTLRTAGPIPGKMILECFPTTKLGYYRPGMKVSWEWNYNNTWRYSMWYKDPQTHSNKIAFQSSTDFVGRNIKEVQPK